LKQVELAKEVGMSEPTISKILSGKRRPSWRVAKALARATGSAVELWMEGTPEQKAQALKNSEG
jgi:transcriptional regulator with XRE-family HTH domain